MVETNPKPIVVKIGGSTLGAHDTTLADVVALQREGVPVVVVHGGGADVTRWLDRQGITARFVRGLRVTDEGSLSVVVAVLAGLVNKQLVAGIGALGGRAVGICGVDGPTILARVTDPAFGRVGQVAAVHTSVIDALLGAGVVPVIAPIGAELRDAEAAGSADGHTIDAAAATHPPATGGEPAATTDGLLNINADTVAGEVAAALGAARLVFLTDVPGVKGADGALLATLDRAQCAELIASGAIGGGMIPKVEACIRAAEGGAAALIVDGREPHALVAALRGDGSGTQIGECKGSA